MVFTTAAVRMIDPIKKLDPNEKTIVYNTNSLIFIIKHYNPRSRKNETN